MLRTSFTLLVILVCSFSQAGHTSAAHWQEEEAGSPLLHHYDLSISKKLRKKESYQQRLADYSVNHDLYKRNLKNSKKAREYLEKIDRTVQSALTSLLENQNDHKGALRHIIEAAADFVPYPTYMTPHVEGLLPIPGFFTGSLEMSLCSGFFSGEVTNASVSLSDEEWNFSVIIGHQQFNGALPRTNIKSGPLTLRSTKHPENQIAVNLSSAFPETPEIVDVSDAWQSFFGLGGEISPAVFYASSIPLPRGIEITGYVPSPITMSYHRLRTSSSCFLGRLLGWDKKSGSGCFSLTDGSGKSMGKILLERRISSPFSFSPLAPFEVPIRVETGFDPSLSFEQVVLWTLLKPKIPDIHLSFSTFDADFRETVQKFSSKEFWQRFKKVILPLLDLPAHEETPQTTIETLKRFQVLIGDNLFFLDRFDEIVKRLNNTNKEKSSEIHALGKALNI